HFYEIGTADTEERNPGFARDGASQQGLARSRRSHEQTPFGNSAAESREFFRLFLVCDVLLQIIFGIIYACKIANVYTVWIVRKQSRSALAKGHRLAPAHLHLAHKKYPHSNQKQHGKPVEQ